MEFWVKKSKLFNYADNRTSDSKGKKKEEILQNLEEDAQNILEFMTSNGLRANPNKTVFLMLNGKENPDQEKTTVKVGPNLI